MSRSARLVGVACMALGIALVAACGTDEVAIGDAPPGSSGGTSGTSGGADGSTTTDASGEGGGSSGGEGGVDAGTDAKVADAGPDTGAPGSNPNQISCEGMTCTVGTEQCCRSASTATCSPVGDPCVGGASLTCDEKADCPGGMLCCSQGLGTTCKESCGSGGAGGGIQICKTNAECSGGTCYVNKCGGFGGGGGTIIPACTKIPGCTQ